MADNLKDLCRASAYWILFDSVARIAVEHVQRSCNSGHTQKSGEAAEQSSGAGEWKPVISCSVAVAVRCAAVGQWC